MSNANVTTLTKGANLYPREAVLSKHYDAHIQAQAWYVFQKRWGQI